MTIEQVEIVCSKCGQVIGDKKVDNKFITETDFALCSKCIRKRHAEQMIEILPELTRGKSHKEAKRIRLEVMKLQLPLMEILDENTKKYVPLSKYKTNVKLPKDPDVKDIGWWCPYCGGHNRDSKNPVCMGCMKGE